MDSDESLNGCTLLALPTGVSPEYQHHEASRSRALLYRNALGQRGDLTYQYDANGSRTGVQRGTMQHYYPFEH
jgi:hypothetical protein